MNRCSFVLMTSWLLAIVLASSDSTFGQDEERVGERMTRTFREGTESELETDRDSFTPATTLVGKGRLLLESSYSFIHNIEGADTHSFPELLTRVGITDKLEIRFGWNYELGGGGSVSNTGSPVEEKLPGEGREEEGGLLYGLKVSVTEQDRWLPRSALIVQASTPTSGLVTATNINTAYVFGWTLPNDWTLDSSLRYATASEEGDHFNLWAPSIVLRVPLNEKWKAHIEYFGFITQNREVERDIHYFSPGIHYLITPDLEIGIRTGWGLNDDSARFFTNVGAGVRF